MKVYQLIEKLQQMDQEAVVECFQGYASDVECWSTIDTVEQEPTGWDDINNEQMHTVFIR